MTLISNKENTQFSMRAVGAPWRDVGKGKILDVPVDANTAYEVRAKPDACRQKTLVIREPVRELRFTFEISDCGGDGIHEELNKLCRDLAGQIVPRLPADATVAILPLTDTRGRILELGVTLAEGIHGALSMSGVRTVNRTRIGDVIDEKVIQEVMRSGSAADRSAIQKAGGLVGATVLVVGRIGDAGGWVLVSAEALDVRRPGATFVHTEHRSLKSADVWKLMKPRDPG